MFRPLWAILQVTKIYNDEKLYIIRTLVVHILGFQRDLVVLRLSILKLNLSNIRIVSFRIDNRKTTRFR